MLSLAARTTSIEGRAVRSEQVIVAGLGEVGGPLLELLSREYDVVGVDIGASDGPDSRPVAALHVCYPFAIDDFLGETSRYIKLFQPGVTIINSTVAVGTTRAVHDLTGAAVVNSPIRGKHARMLDELLRYTKFIGALDDESGRFASDHFEAAGMRTRALSSPEATELAKLTETTYFGLLIAWAQEIERYCDQLDQEYDEVVSFFDEISFLPQTRYFPGAIGGHCVMPNIEILGRARESDLLRAIQSSNALKLARKSGAIEGTSPEHTAAR